MILATAIVLAGLAAPTASPTATPWPAPPIQMEVVASRPTVDVSSTTICGGPDCDLETFLTEVVAAEVPPDAPAAVLEAQAIVIRTNLLARHLVCDFSLLERLGRRPVDERRSLAIDRAVSKTYGLVLRRKDGGLAVEPFRAACQSDLRSIEDLDDFSMEGRRPFAGAGPGPGLCVKGAELRARQGATASQILALYFPNARIAR